MSWDPIWENIFIDNDWGQYPDIDVVSFIAKNYYETKNRGQIRILEIGSGTGANLWYLAREGFSTFGIDGSKTGIEKAKIKLERENLRADLFVDDIKNLDHLFEDGYFDCVLDVGCLCCNSQLATSQILQGVSKILKPSGLLFSKTFSDKLFLGKDFVRINEFEVKDLKEGPLKGKGFLRLADRNAIEELYGKSFNSLSIDYLDYSINNGSMSINWWIVQGKNIVT